MLNIIFWTLLLTGVAALFYTLFRHRYAPLLVPAAMVLLLFPLAALADDQNASQAIQDALSGHANILVGVAGALALLVPIVLHLMGKEIPGVSAALDALVTIVRNLKLPSPENKDAEAKVNTDGLSSVVKLEEVKPKDPEPKP